MAVNVVLNAQTRQLAYMGYRYCSEGYASRVGLGVVHEFGFVQSARLRAGLGVASDAPRPRARVASVLVPPVLPRTRVAWRPPRTGRAGYTGGPSLANNATRTQWGFSC